MESQDDAAFFEPPQHEPLFEVTDWQAVALWSWKRGGTVCPICADSFFSSCVQCQATGMKTPLDSLDKTSTANAKAESSRKPTTCPILWGQCGHGAHQHCLLHWWALSRDKLCPTCTAHFEIDREQAD